MSGALQTHVTDRAIRQRDLVPPAALLEYHALVVGVGAVGRQVALQLAATGVPTMTLVDDDTVAIENLAVQGFRQSDLGRLKVEGTAQQAQELHHALQLQPIARRFRRSSSHELPCLHSSGGAKLAVFACVDSMAGRKAVWETVRDQAAFFTDGRMAGEVVRILASGHPSIDTHYASTLFDDAQAHPGPCTGRSTLYAASLAASLMICRFAAYLRGLPAPSDTLLNLLSNELVVTD